MKNNSKEITIIGLGYIGLIQTIHLASKGYIVNAIETNPKKHDILRNNQLYVQESGLDELFLKHKENIHLHFSLETVSATSNAPIFVCVGTPNNQDGSVDSSQIEHALKDLTAFLRTSKQVKNIFFRSTLTPGSLNSYIKLIEKETALTHSIEFNLYMFPEFIREGNAIEDLSNINLAVIGSANPNNQIPEIPFFEKATNKFITNYIEAEMIKYLNNSFHALKIAFANEIGEVAKTFGADRSKLFDIFLADTKLNISKKYLRPGFSYGGSCLSKDLIAIKTLAENRNLELPLLNSIEISNENHLQVYLSKILKTNAKKILFTGISFKQNTNDTRNSPVVKLLNLLLLHISPASITIASDYNIDTGEITYPIKVLKTSKIQIEQFDLIVIGAELIENNSKLSTNVINLGFFNDENIKFGKLI